MPDWDEHEWGGVGSPSGRRWSVAAALFLAARTLEAESDRWFLWLPVLFAGGIISYFTLTYEPDPTLAVAMVLAALGLCLMARRAPLGLALAGACLAFALGFGTAKLRAELVRAPVLAKELRYVSVTGFVEEFERRAGRRSRLTLRVISLGDLDAGARPYRVRVSTSAKGDGPRTGEAVSLRATLRPPPEPVEPGGFDFGRQAWFARLGATGYVTTKITPLDDASPPPWDLRAWAAIDSLRLAVHERITAVLPGDTGAIAVALITGERGGIPQPVTEAMRDSGLAHVLAISGLHMVIMAGTVFWLVRALLALIPSLSLRFAIKKWAAATALLAAAFYLVLSGAAVPTLRAWIMMSIFIVAPESLFHPIFEMSFAAVIGLVALYEWLSARARNRLFDVSLLWRSLRWGGALVFGAAATTLVAGTAVAPFAIYHFHRMTHFGLVANMIAAPLVSLLIMPMALISLIAMPLGLEAWPLRAMGFGIEIMVGAAQWVASWPGAVSILPRMSGTALALMVLGGLWLCLWRTRMRAGGLVIIAAGLALAPAGNRPDVLIEREGATAALRSTSGNLVFPPATAASYSVENWLLADGDDRDAEAAAGEGDFRCDPLGCIGRVKGKTVALIRHPGALEEDCRVADIVIAPFTVGKRCRAARGHRRPAHAETRRRARALYRRALDPHRDGRESTRG